MELRLPLEQVRVTQPFGVSYVDFYKKLGLLAHNGCDFSAKTGTNIYAAHDGKVYYAGKDGGGGISVTLVNEKEHYKTIYYHNQKNLVKKGDEVKAGDLIALADNTGIYTTGSHLHFGLKQLDENNFNTINYNNGYKGAIDPAPYFYYSFNGQKISPKDYNKSRCYHRYYRGRPKGGYWIEKYRVVPYLIRRWKRLPNNEEINAAVYGGWDVEAIENPAMCTIWSQLKKDEFKKGKKLTVQGMG